MLYKKLFEGIRGRVAWHFLDRNFRADKYIFFPSEDGTYNKWGILMLPTYVRALQLQKIVVLACDEKVGRAVQNLTGINVVVQHITQKKMLQYLSYYALIDKCKTWTVVSVKQPYETGAERLLGKRGITKKDIIYYDVYGFSNEEVEKEMDETWAREIEKYLFVGETR